MPFPREVDVADWNGMDVVKSKMCQAKYVARCALFDLTRTTIPIGDIDLSREGHFDYQVPDFSQDPLAGVPDQGELQIWARDKTTERMVAQLIPAAPGVMKTRMGGVKILSEYPFRNRVCSMCGKLRARARCDRVRSSAGF